ncbi:hypothetical protein [Nocardioides euryhalodurans]|uniref:Uncharacterized protein n=1 Tax=Nocardioides euryhalodurans TaxID=2518370 RepID=A0A4P7GH11_9ACTN|nr:hypothetical protein [Nocardioides euryhalodurans]QBR91011.1 hypothetical protein EXE57_01045 [Nocardioides euryhalodurans]
MDPRTDLLRSISYVLGALALAGWYAFIRSPEAYWLALSIVSTVGCAAFRLQASIRELEARLTVATPRDEAPGDHA